MQTDKKKNVDNENDEITGPQKYDLQAAHRKVVGIMIGLFVAMLVLMIACSDKVEFASTGGM